MSAFGAMRPVVHATQEEEDSKQIEIQWLVLLHSLLHQRQHWDKTEWEPARSSVAYPKLGCHCIATGNARTGITMDACFSTVYSMSTIVLCLLVGSNNIVLKIQSVVIMHNENKYVSVIRDNRYLTLFIVSGKNPCLMQEHRRYLLCKPSYSLFCLQISLPWQQGSVGGKFKWHR